MFTGFARLVNLLKPKSKRDTELANSFLHYFGIRPLNLEIYKLAIQHSSTASENIGGVKDSYERLEYLGDAVLNTIVADFLFKKYPFKSEGFLTDIRSRIVSRDSLNKIGRKLGIDQIVNYNTSTRHSTAYKSITGDALEAIIGAVYLDRGYDFTKRFIIRKFLFPNLDLESIIKTNPNFKSKIIEWAHRNNESVRFEILEIKNNKHFKEFIAQVMIGDKPVGKGTGLSKKRAEQDAAENSCSILKID